MDSAIFPASKMGFGCMRLPLLDPNDMKSIDMAQFQQMVDIFMEAGNTYFDTAFVYHEGESEVALGKALVARGGRLCNLPEEVASVLATAKPGSSQAEWAYRFCWNLPNVVAVLSGMSTMGQARENVEAYKRNAPFSNEEQAALEQAVQKLRSMTEVPCTACNYCVKGCPSGVKIPQIMGLLNLEAMTRDRDFVKGLYSWQAAEGRASECIQCGLCESMCPQQIDIIHQLEVAAEKYE